jgi:hypothetical protein
MPIVVAALALIARPASLRGDDAPPRPAPPGTYRTEWLGNTFGGDGGPNGFGHWVQNGADEIEVTPDGTVVAGVAWDEAGRCAGLYKDGRVNRVLLKGRQGVPETAWGFNTANNAIAAWGEFLFVANIGKRLLRFRWKPGELDSAQYVDEVTIDADPVGLSARGETLALVYKDSVEIRGAGDLKPIRRFAAPGARDVAIDPGGDLWILAGDAVRRTSADGKPRGMSVPGLEHPSAIAIDHRGRLIVCDDGRRQQVLFFDVTAAPRLVQTFGEKGGLRAGVPGAFAPRKLFALRGAGTDAAGNLYVALSFGNGATGNLFLRSFRPDGTPRWEVFSTAFVDTFGFDPESDGRVVYGRTAVYDLSLDRPEPIRGGRIRAVTLDHVRYPGDDRLKNGSSMLVRHPGGRTLVYTIGQYGGGYRLLVPESSEGHVLREVDRIHPEGETWAWDVDADATIWHGDAPEKTIRRYPFRGWTSDGKPIYDWSHPRLTPWPSDWAIVRRIRYDKAADALYLSGYLDGQKPESWGVAGATLRRYDGWLAGKKAMRWSVPLPRDGSNDPNVGPLTPSSIAFAGDYLFAGLVKPTAGKQLVHVLRLADGKDLGAFAPGPEVGGTAGWLDMPYSTQALRRKNGEYLILVEEDARGKNLLYRWRPDAAR